MKALKTTTYITSPSECHECSFRKGQVSSGEIVLAYFIFFIALTVAVTMWMDEINHVQVSSRFSDFEDSASDIAEKLVRTQGIPNNWDESSVATIGLADEPRVLSQSKILMFVDLMNESKASMNPNCTGDSNYNCSKSLLGVGKYDFYLTIEDLNGTVISVNNTKVIAGRYPVEETDKLTITRPSIVNNTIVQLKLTLWYTQKGETE
jgi:hypothetical protein